MVPSVYTVFDHEKRPINTSSVYSFSGLISFTDFAKRETEEHTYCGSGLTFDVVKVNSLDNLWVHVLAKIRKINEYSC